MKTLVLAVSIGLILAAPRAWGAPPKNPNEVMVGVGMAGSYQSPYRRAPTVSVMYLRKFQWVLGNHVEAVFGLGESVWGVSYQLDAWLNENMRIGAGVGAVPFVEDFTGNPILIPMPEASIGYQFRTGALSYSGGATFNLIYGARAFAGLGYPF